MPVGADTWPGICGNVVAHHTPGTAVILTMSVITNKDKWLESPLAGNLIKCLGNWRVVLNSLTDGQESLQRMKPKKVFKRENETNSGCSKGSASEELTRNRRDVH